MDGAQVVIRYDAKQSSMMRGPRMLFRLKESEIIKHSRREDCSSQNLQTTWQFSLEPKPSMSSPNRKSGPCPDHDHSQSMFHSYSSSMLPNINHSCLARCDKGSNRDGKRGDAGDAGDAGVSESRIRAVCNTGEAGCYPGTKAHRAQKRRRSRQSTGSTDQNNLD